VPAPAGRDSPTDTSDPQDCRQCPTLLTFGDESPTVTADATTTITGRLYNPYPFTLSSVAVELDPPGPNWTVTPINGNAAETLGPRESRPVAWSLRAPPGAAGTHTLPAVSVYADGRGLFRATGTYDLAVEAPGLRPPAVPPCTEALGPLVDGGTCHLLTLDDDPPELVAGATTTVTGRLYNPRNDDLTNGSVALDPPGTDWSVTPINGSAFDLLRSGEVRRAAWNVTPPVSASGSYRITGNTTYTRLEGPGRANRTARHTYRVVVSPAPVTRPPAETPCRLESGPIDASGPCYLLTFPGDPPAVTAGATTTITGRLYNPREYALANGSVTLDAPGANWTITPVAGTTFDRLDPGTVRIARWNVTAPASATGTVDLSGVTAYTRRGGPGEPNVSLRHRYPVAMSAANASRPAP
jgi:hypothetical protein